MIYDQPNDICFSNKTESFQYNMTPAIIGAIKCTLKEKNVSGIRPWIIKEWKVIEVTVLFS